MPWYSLLLITGLPMSGLLDRETSSLVALWNLDDFRLKLETHDIRPFSQEFRKRSMAIQAKVGRSNQLRSDQLTDNSNGIC